MVTSTQALDRGITTTTTISQDFTPGKLGAKYINSLRSSNYTAETAVGEHCDNSKDAGATRINIDFESKSEKSGNKTLEYVKKIFISDNGKGMGYDTLEESFVLGADREYTETDTGKFGKGGTESSLSIARKKTVITSTTAGSLIARCYDLDVVNEMNAWGSSKVEVTDELKDLFEEKVLKYSDTGTLIILEDLDKLKPKTRRALNSRVVRYCSSTYNDYIMSGNKIFVQGEMVEQFDPLFWNDSSKNQRIFEKIVHEGQTITVRGMTVERIPNSCYSHSVNSIINNSTMTESSGAYFYRGKRLILGPVCNGKYLQSFYNRHSDSRHFRWSVSYEPAADEIMGTSNSKDSINMDQALMDKIRNIVMPVQKAVQKEQKNKEARKNRKDAQSTLKKIEEQANRSIITEAPKGEKSNSLPKKGNVVPMNGARVRRKNYKLELVNHGIRGAIADVAPSTDAEYRYILRVNQEHPTMVEILGESEKTQSIALQFVVSMLASIEEFGNPEDCPELGSYLDTMVHKVSIKLSNWTRNA